MTTSTEEAAPTTPSVSVDTIDKLLSAMENSPRPWYVYMLVSYLKPAHFIHTC